IARFVAEARQLGREVVLVSSGAVAAGRAVLGIAPGAPRTVAAKQALAAVGQARMMDAWSRLFDTPCAQVLLAYDDLVNRRRFVNAKNTLRELLALGTLPIVNENDSVAVDELKLGDNDNLAAHVAVLAEADLLIMLTDIDGLFEADPRRDPDAKLITDVHVVDDALLARCGGGAGSSVGTGGMRTKLEAAQKAAARGVPAVVANGRRGDALDALLRGESPGTYFHATRSAISAKDHWMRHALASAGAIVVDGGAARALTARGASLLPPGVVDVRGAFRAGDAVDVVAREAAAGEGGAERAIAKGVSQYDAGELKRIMGRGSHEIEALLGYSGSETVIHRDDLVLL
ncbi:MAG TPA: glutamate 5-kinase, partial [Xanthomonadales bacterium]|nr:glutamate 5-kinase [Xanthomonadales bacterium]